MRVTVGGALIKEGKILLGFRSEDKAYFPSTWDLIGGHCEDGETVDQALVREFEEEVGVTPLRFWKLCDFDEPDPEKYGSGRHHFYVVWDWEGEPSNVSDEHQSIRWFSIQEFTNLHLASPIYIELFGSFL